MAFASLVSRSLRRTSLARVGGDASAFRATVGPEMTREGDRISDFEGRLDILTKFMGGVVFEVDRDGRYLQVWAGNSALLARPAEELLGHTVTEVLGPEHGNTFDLFIRRVMEGGGPDRTEYTLDVPAGRRVFLCEGRKRKRSDGAATVMLLVRDVTEETELKAKLVEAERLAAVGLLAASVGHEIRQPLAFATTSLEVLARECEPQASDRAREALAHVRDAVRRLAQIASSLGIVAADRRRSTRPRTNATTLRRPLDAALDLCASVLKEHTHVEVKVPTLPPVAVNEGELCQVFSNVLLNAAQAMNEGTPAMNRLAISATREPRALRVSFADTGCGIADEDLAHIYDPFFSTKEEGRGSGLGLYISRRIVEEAGGRIEVRSQRGQGTTVDVVLPIADDVTLPPASKPLGQVEPVAPAARRLTILVVDDEPAFLRSLELVLKDMHEVVVADRSRRALELLRENPTRFDAVLCDLSMPGLDGVALYEEAERLGIGSRFILMTAGAFTTRADDFLARAKCKRIGKPFTLDKLMGVLDAVVKG